METGVAAARWAEIWQRAWPARDAEAIELLYAPNASYRSSALADPDPGGITAYLAPTVRGRAGRAVLVRPAGSRPSQGCCRVVGQLGGGRSDSHTRRRHPPTVRHRRSSC